MNDKPQALGEFLNAISPHVSTDIRKGIESVRGILALYPGQSAADVFASIQKMQASAATSVTAMIERARLLIQPASPEAAHADSLEAFLKDAGKLGPDDLKSLMDGISLPSPKGKKAILAEIKLWLESKGTYAPKSAADKKRERAQMLLGDIPQRLGQMTNALADEIIARATEASKDKELGADGFTIYASLLLGMPMKGTKPKLLGEIKAFVDRLAVSAAQTKF